MDGTEMPGEPEIRVLSHEEAERLQEEAFLEHRAAFDALRDR